MKTVSLCVAGMVFGLCNGCVVPTGRTDKGGTESGMGIGSDQEDTNPKTESEIGTADPSLQDTHSQVPSEEWPCPEPVAATCTDPVSPLPVLLTASELGDNVVFAALNEDTVLAVQHTETEQTVILREIQWSALEDGGGTAILKLEPEVKLETIAVTSSALDELPSRLAFLCVDDVCSLFGADIPAQGTVELNAVKNGTPPDIGKVVGMWTGRDGPDTVCLYGDKISCFDGNAWRIPYTGDNGAPPVADMKTLGFGIVAVGERGLVVRDGFPAWTTGWGEVYPDLVSVAVRYDDYLGVSRDGRFYNISKMWNPPCKIVVDEEVSQYTYTYGENQPEHLGVTASGKVFVGSGAFDRLNNFCFTGQQWDNVVGTASYTCGLAGNHLVLTSDTLYGTIGCIID